MFPFVGQDEACSSFTEYARWHQHGLLVAQIDILHCKSPSPATWIWLLDYREHAGGQCTPYCCQCLKALLAGHRVLDDLIHVHADVNSLTFALTCYKAILLEPCHNSDACQWVVEGATFVIFSVLMISTVLRRWTCTLTACHPRSLSRPGSPPTKPQVKALTFCQQKTFTAQTEEDR